MDCKCAIKPVNKRLHFKVDILSVYFRPIIFLKTRDCTRITTLLIVFILSFNDETYKGIELHLGLVFYLCCLLYLNTLICRLILQVLYCTIDVSIHNRGGDSVYLVTDTPVVCWILAFVWPLILIPILELIKRREIR